MRSTQRRRQANEGKRRLGGSENPSLGHCAASDSKEAAVEKRRQMHFLSNEVEDKWIEDYVEIETAGARKRVENAEARFNKELDDMTQDEIAELMSREPEKTFEEMLVAIGDSLVILQVPTMGGMGRRR